MRWIAMCAVGALGWAAVCPAWAETQSLRPGDRVRYSLRRQPAGSEKGSVIELRNDALVIDSGDDSQARVVRLSSLASLEVDRGKGRNWATGAVIGFIPGAIFGAYVGREIDCYAGCKGDSATIPATLFAGGVTAAIGAGIGALVKTTRWERVTPGDITMSVAPTPGRGVSVQLTLRF